MSDGYLTDDEYRDVYSKVPRLCVDLVIRDEEEFVLLTRREQKPHVGCWHLPGGRVWKGETIHMAARRIAQREVGNQINIGECLGFLEVLDDPGDLVVCHSTSIVLACTLCLNLIVPGTRQGFAWFNKIPVGVHPEHGDFLQQVRDRSARI